MEKWLGIVVALLVLAGCGSQETPTRQNDWTPLTSILISSTVETLPAGVSIQLTATGNYSGLFTRDITSQVTWSSAQTNVADFTFPSSPGRVKALVAGPATITATLNGIVAGSFNLTVSDAVISTLTVAPPLPSLPLGSTQVFTVQGTFSDAITRDLTKDVIWSSSDVTVASISDDFASKGTATALTMGTTIISAQFGTFPPASTTLTVTAAALSSIAVTPANASLLGLSNGSFTATGTFSDKSTRDVTTEVTWESSDPAVATVATANTVKALTPGQSTIKATLGTVSGTSNLKVTGGRLSSIALNLVHASNNTLLKGTRSRITARGTFDNGTSRDITGAATMVVDSTNASVTPIRGNLAWVQAVEDTLTTPAKISASYEGVVSPESSLTVTAPALNGGSLSIPEQTLTLSSGSSEQLSLTGLFSVASSQNLALNAEWSSASPAIATVGNIDLIKGRVTAALTAGTAVITATYGEQTATTTVTVAARTLDALTISLSSPPAAIIAGAELPYAVTARYTDGTTQDVTIDATWTIDNPNVAKFSDPLSDPGLVVAVDAGTTILKATFGGKEDTETLTVF